MIEAREKDLRGSSTDRRRRKQWLLDQYGDGVTVPCTYCAKPLDFDTVTTDRIVPGSEGGRYTRDNIQPACSRCNKRRQDTHDPTFREWYEEFLGDLTTTGQMSLVDPLPVIDNDYRHREVAAMAEDEVDNLIGVVEGTEAVVTPMLEDIAREYSGNLEGLNYRFKTRDSLLNKIQRKKQKLRRDIDPYNEITDALRYTVSLPAEEYTEGVNKILGKIQAQGWELKEIENSWTPGDPYSGLHVVVNVPDGVNFELQFHTPDSYRTKDQITHQDYVEYRDPNTPLERKQELYEQMAEAWGSVPVPEGVHDIGDYIFYPFPLSSRLRFAKIDPSGFIMVEPRMATNWTMDGLPIEDGFDVMSAEEEETEAVGLGLQSLARTASTHRRSTWEELQAGGTAMCGQCGYDYRWSSGSACPNCGGTGEPKWTQEYAAAHPELAQDFANLDDEEDTSRHSSWMKAAGDDYWTDVTDDDHLLEVEADADDMFVWTTSRGDDTIASGREETLTEAQQAARSAIGVTEAEKTAAMEWQGRGDDFQFVLLPEGGEVTQIDVSWQDPELYGEHDEGNWMWALRDRRQMEVEYGFAETAEEAKQEAEAAYTGQGTLFASKTAKTWTLFWDDSQRRKDKWTLIEADETAAQYHRLTMADDFADAMLEAEKISGIDPESWDEVGVNSLNNEGFARKEAAGVRVAERQFDVDIEDMNDNVRKVTVRHPDTQDVIRTLHVEAGPNQQARIEELLDEIANGPRFARVAATDDYMGSWWSDDTKQIVVGQLMEEHGATGNIAREEDWDDLLADTEMLVESFVEEEDWDAIASIYERATGWNPTAQG